MSRPQNGVNGGIPQQPYGYMTNSYPQVPRNQNQNMYGYADMSQVVPNHYVPQGYQTSLSHNAANNIRPVSPLVAPTQYAFFQYPSYAQSSQSYNQYPYAPNYIQNHQYIFPPENSVTTSITNPPVARKCQPLAVFDPINNTDLDLSKYQTLATSYKKSKDSLENLKFDRNDSSIDKIQKHFDIEDIKKYIVDKRDDFSENDGGKILLVEENLEDVSEDKDNEKIEETSKLDIIYENETKIYDEKKAEKYEEWKEVLNTENDENKFEEKCNEYKEDKVIKIDSLLEKSDIEDEFKQSLEIECLKPSKINSLNYFLLINKKESDETTLKRKLTYDREYLITIKSHSQSQKKPLNLPSTSDFSEEIIYDESQNISLKKPDVFQNTLNNNDKFGKKQVPKFQQPPGRRYIKSNIFQPKLINLDINENQVFTRSKSSYLPPQLRNKEKEVDLYLELKRNIKGNLNKITPQNFQECLSEITKLNIKEKEEMACLINEIFIKAVQEEAYSVTYAQFCNKLAHSYTEIQSFKSQLLKKCQDMFQTPIQSQLDSVRKEWMLKIDNEADSKLKLLYESDLEEQVKKAKDRYFGNIRFIGELFLHNLLAGKVILNCIMELLKGKNDSDAMLALCKLMETCGKQIDERHNSKMEYFINCMDDLSKSQELETRIRFKLKDIIDMRKRSWILRHIQQEKKINPKTMEEQKEEAAAEAANKLILSQTNSKRNHQNMHDNSARRQPNLQQKPISLKNLRCQTHSVNERTVLGPDRNVWAAGSGSKQKNKDSDTFMPISAKHIKDVQSPDSSPQIKVKNRYHTLESSTEGSGADSRSSTPPITDSVNVNKVEVVKKEIELIESMNDDERADIIFNDLMLTGDFDVNNWIQLTNVKPIIEKWIDNMMEKDPSCRRSVGDSFIKLIDQNIMTYDQLTKGLMLFISCVDDLIYDIPKLWEFFAQFLERFIRDKSSNINFFLDIFKDILPNEDVAICLSIALHAASSRLGHNIVGQVFYRSSLKWNNIVPNDWEYFVRQYDLNFTITGGVPLSSCGGYSLQSIANELESMLKNNLSNEEIFEFFEKHIDKPTWKSKECTSTITRCILKAMKGQSKLNVRGYLKDKSEIIKQFSQNKVANEIEVLKSVSNVADELDIEILTTVYDIIMTGEIVSNDSFDFYLNDNSFKSEPNFDLTFQIISQCYVPKSDR